MNKKKNGFTVLEMLLVLLIVCVLVMLTLPNIQQKEKIVRTKGCEALVEVVNAQILMYEIEEDETPGSVDELIAKGYLKEGQQACPNGETISIQNGQASSG